MRKIYNLLVLAVLFMVGTTAVQAEKRYRVEGGTIASGYAWTVDVAQGYADTGTPFVIQSGLLGDGSNDFIQGLGKSSTITDDNLFVLVSAGENADGEAQYMLQRQSTGEYLASASYSFTSVSARAWKFLILEPTTFSDDQLTDTSGENGTNAYINDWRTVTTCQQADNSFVVFVDASAKADTTVTTKSNVKFLLSGEQSKAASFGHSFSQNALELFGVTELTGAEYVEEALKELFPDDTADLYNVGTDAGQISQELYDELLAAYNAACDLRDNASTDQDACEAAIERCKAAIEAAKSGAVPMQEGYYYFGGTRTEAGTNAVYDDGSGMHWTYGQTWERPETLDMNNAKYVWYLKPADGYDGGYYVQNFYTKRYANVSTSRGAYIKTVENIADAEVYLIYPYDKNYFIIQSSTVKENNIEGWNGVMIDGSMHQPGDHNNLVLWTVDAEASHWKFMNVPQDQIDALEKGISQAQLNEAMKELVDDAQASYDKGFSHSFTGGARSGAIDIAEDGVTPAGLVTSLDQLSFNATETQEGSVDALLDCALEAGVFYHSIWNSDTETAAGYDHTTMYPYIQADLGKAVSEVTMKMWPRYDNNNGYYTSNLPGKMHVLATNDPDGEWTEIGYTTTQVAWQFPVDNGDGTTTLSSSKVVGYATIDFGGASYQYVRFEVTTRNGSSNDFKALGLGQACFNMGEIRFFESQYDPSISIIEAVPTDVREAFETALEQAKVELESESATQATYDALEAAYETFLENYPDPDVVKDMLEEAYDVYEASEESASGELGYYEAGSRQELLAALEAVEAGVSDVMSVDEVNAAKEAIKTALANFNAKLYKPEANQLYYIKSVTGTAKADGGAENAYMYATGNGANVRWASSEELDPTTIPQYVWRLEAQGNGYVFRNMLTNEVMNNPRQNNVSVSMSAQADTCAVTISSSAAGIFNIVLDDNIYLNAQPTGSTTNIGNGSVVTWNTASGNDNSAFTFIPVEDEYDSSFEWSVTKGQWNIVTLPVPGVVDGTIYTFVGRNGDDMVLQEIAGGEVEGGQPFFYKAGENEGDDVIFIDTDASSWETLAATAVTTAKNVNGLVGTLAPISELNPDYGILYGGATIVNSEKGEGVSNNSGYFDPATLATTTEAGDATVPVEGTLSAINTAAVDNAAATSGNVYNLSGVKVRSNVKSLSDLNGLPAGIYILGNQKVIIK